MKARCGNPVTSLIYYVVKIFRDRDIRTIVIYDSGSELFVIKIV